MSILSRVSCVAVLLLLLLLLLIAPQASWAQSGVKDAPAKAQQESRPQFPDLMSGLKETEGCLGVESARTSSGKNVIFAWFKDKEAVMNWYDSDMHQGVMDQFFPEREPREVLADVPDDSGPIMAIASITYSDKPQVDGTSLPISQIAIELYGPVPGGLAFGGRFAPDTVEVKNLNDYSQSEEK